MIVIVRMRKIRMIVTDRGFLDRIGVGKEDVMKWTEEMQP